MITAAADQGIIDGDKVMLESLISLKRAGAMRSSPISRRAWRKKLMEMR